MSATHTPTVLEVHVDNLREDPENPNRMSPAQLDALTCAIERLGGMYQPILVRKGATPDDPYEIVDGHNRVRAARRVGIERVLAVVWDGSDAMRAALAVGFNHLRGELDLATVALTVEAAMATMTTAEETAALVTLTGYTANEMQELIAATHHEVNEEEIMERPAPPPKGEAPERPLVMELTFATAADLKTARRGLRRAAGKGRPLGEGLLTLLKGGK